MSLTEDAFSPADPRVRFSILRIVRIFIRTDTQLTSVPIDFYPSRRVASVRGAATENKDKKEREERYFVGRRREKKKGVRVAAAGWPVAAINPISQPVY